MFDHFPEVGAVKLVTGKNQYQVGLQLDADQPPLQPRRFDDRGPRAEEEIEDEVEEEDEKESRAYFS